MKHAPTILIAVLALLVGCGIGWMFGAGSQIKTASVPPAQHSRLADLDARLAKHGEQLEALRGENKQLRDKLKSLQGSVDKSNNNASLLDALRLQEGRIQSVLQQMQALEAKRYADTLRGATVLRESGLLDEALVELCKAVAIAPDNYGGYVNRGMVYQDLGQWENALADFETAARLNPDNIVPWNNLAWLKATCPDDSIRNGALAVEHATKACEKTEWKSFATLSTLAAAYAEAGDFPAAVKWQQKSLETAPEVLRTKLEASLALFQAEKPLRATAKRAAPRMN